MTPLVESVIYIAKHLDVKIHLFTNRPCKYPGIEVHNGYIKGPVKGLVGMPTVVHPTFIYKKFNYRAVFSRF